MTQPERRLTHADLRDLKELLGLSLMDFAWLMVFHAGDANWVSAKPEHARKRVEDPVLSGLTRLVYLLATDPEFHVLPRMPTALEVFERLREPYRRVTGRELKAGHFAALCLVTPQALGDWLRSRPVSIRSQRHLFLLDWLVKRGGDKALREYLRVLDIEAKTRGFENLEEVIRARSWAVRGSRTRGRHSSSPGRAVQKSGRGRPTRQSR